MAAVFPRISISSWNSGFTLQPWRAWRSPVDYLKALKTSPLLWMTTVGEKKSTNLQSWQNEVYCPCEQQRNKVFGIPSALLIYLKITVPCFVVIFPMWCFLYCAGQSVNYLSLGNNTGPVPHIQAKIDLNKLYNHTCMYINFKWILQRPQWALQK